jgi:hypothetical protein
LSEQFSLAISPGANLQLINVIDIPLKKHAEAAMPSDLSVSQEVHNFHKFYVAAVCFGL